MLGVFFKTVILQQYRTAEMPNLSLTQCPVCYSLHFFSPTAELSQSTFVWPRMDVFCVLMRSVCKSHFFIPFPTQQHFTSCPNGKDMWSVAPDLPALLTSTERTNLLKPVQIKTDAQRLVMSCICPSMGASPSCTQSSLLGVMMHPSLVPRFIW